MVINNFVFFKKSFYTNSFMVYRYFGVKKKSYMGDLVTKMYDFYCRGAKNLYREYKRYYKKEFSSYEEFLLKKYNLFHHEVDDLSSPLLYCKDIGELKDYSIEQLCEDEEIQQTLYDFLGGRKNED